MLHLLTGRQAAQRQRQQARGRREQGGRLLGQIRPTWSSACALECWKRQLASAGAKAAPTTAAAFEAWTVVCMLGQLQYVAGQWVAQPFAAAAAAAAPVAASARCLLGKLSRCQHICTLPNPAPASWRVCFASAPRCLDHFTSTPHRSSLPAGWKALRGMSSSEHWSRAPSPYSLRAVLRCLEEQLLQGLPGEQLDAVLGVSLQAVFELSAVQPSGSAGDGERGPPAPALQQWRRALDSRADTAASSAAAAPAAAGGAAVAAWPAMRGDLAEAAVELLLP